MDTNVWHDVREGKAGTRDTNPPARFDYATLIKGLMFGVGECRHAVVAYGGEVYINELTRDVEARRWIAMLDRAGKAYLADGDEVDAKAEELRTTDSCRSNDHHIIALAHVSGARVLCTRDARLMEDFRDKSLLDEPRGSVYSLPAHNHLVRERCGD